MSSTLLERTRASHEELERLQRLLVAELKEAPKTHKEGVDQSHRINHVLGRITETSTTLEKIYTDTDGSRKDGIASIAGSGPSLYSLFYDRLREIKEYHRKYPELEVERPENLHIPPPNIAFTGEEKYGKYLDLNGLFVQYINLEGIDKEKMDYLTFLREFHVHDKMPESRFYSRQYKKYADELQEYLVSFFERTQPLLDLEKELQPHIKEFEAKWERGELQNGSAVEKNDNNNNINNNNNNNNGTNTNTPTPTPTTTPSPAPSTTPATTSTENKKRKNKKKKNKKEKSDEPKSDTGAAEPMEVDAKKTPDFDNPLYCRACIFPSSKQSLQIITIHILITITM